MSAVAALRVSEQRFRGLVESIPHLLWTCAGDGACDYVSPQWTAYTGLPAADQLGYGWLDQIHPADRDETRARWATAAATGGVFEIQVRIRRDDGVYRWFQARATPVRDDTGRIATWFGSTTDIHELREAQVATVDLAEAPVPARSDDLRAANTELASVARQLQAAQRVAQVGSWEFDLATHQVAWSEQLYRIIGMDPRSPTLDFHAQEAIYTPASWALLAGAVQRTIARGEPYELTLELLRPDGERRTVIARGEAVLGATGVPEKLVGTLQDVTELARMRSELVRLSERTQIAMATANVGVWEWNLADNVLVWDDTMHRLYDAGPGEFAGAYEAWRSRVYPDDLAATEAELRDAIAGTRDFQSEFRIVWKNREVRHLRPAAAVQRDPDTGLPVRVIGVNWDITEQRLAETALRSNEALQRGILAHAGSAIIATDREGTITLFNRAAEELLGYSAQELLGAITPIVIHAPDQVDARRAVLERELGVRIASAREVVLYKARQGKPETHEWAYLRKDGSRVPVLLTVSALRDDAGAIFGYLGVALDLTLRKQEEAALVELNRLLAERSAQAESASHAKTMFVANMSHEIRTPMNAITGVSYLLNRTELSPEQRDLVHTLNSATKTLLGMISDVLDLSKIEAQQLTLDEGPFRLSQLLDDLRAMMAALAAEKRLELVFETDADAPEHLVGDSMRLTQILTNLVGNAIKFTAAGLVRLGTRVVAGDGERTWLRFEVRDTGPGIDEDLLPRLFTPFTQADHPGAHRAGGTGLGLAIVRQLATLMGGEVGVASTRGAGSEFWCRLPFARLARERRGSWPANLKLLVVEPHDLQRDTIVSSVQRCGWQVVEAGSSEQVLASVLDEARAGAPFDAILLGASPPGSSAVAAVQAVRASIELARQPAIIIMAPRDLAALRSQELGRGADAVLGKPISGSALFDAVTQAVSARALSRRRPRDTPAKAGGVQRLAGTRLLVVDDSKLNQIVVRRILEREGARVETADDGLDAVARVLAAPAGHDAVLMDVQMPQLDGIEATRRIRGIAGCASLPIIAVTAGALAAERELVLAAGVNDVISKPFDPEVVVASIRKYIKRVRGRSIAIPLPRAPRAEWPAIDGIDARDAELRLGGDLTLFGSLLGLFAVDLDAVERALATAAADADPAPLAQWMHRVRGTAGNLGARDLHVAASEAEHGLRAGQIGQGIEGVPRVLEQIIRLRRSIGGFLSSSASNGPDAPSAGATESIDPAALAAFMQCLRDHDMGALTSRFARSPALAGALGDREHTRMCSLLDRLDFEAAFEIVRTLAHPVEPRSVVR
jgi:PAS domain S-box-containing protein